MREGVSLTRAEIVWLYENVGEGQTVTIEPDLGREFRIFPCVAIEDGKIVRNAVAPMVNREGKVTM